MGVLDVIVGVWYECVRVRVPLLEQASFCLCDGLIFRVCRDWVSLSWMCRIADKSFFGRVV